ncbi:LysR family transcriptional regulator [Spirochaeta cellobiosiphila]|uniref:LysR family transcriptional regulator n=1 Tax=Spirochaeta cellobiosiphila TaxID=504483 RepID=UPI0004127313|nr:LysR family transcriptional regulator [Spirochaeta cellobiosiphila]
MNISWEWYKVFYHVASEQSISRAASLLHISQPAVSQTIKQMEEDIGFSLFIRTPKGVTLTEQGKGLYTSINQTFHTIKSAESKLEELNNSHTGAIRFGASDTLCSHYLIDYLKQYRKEHPKVRLHVYNMTTDQIIHSLQKGEIDLGFINLPNKLNENIELQNIKTLQDCFICGEQFKDHFKEPVPLQYLTRYPLILLEEGTNMRRFIDQYFSSNKVECKPELELGSIDMLTKFAAADFGISFVTKDFIEKELSTKEVYMVNVKEPIPSRSIGIIKIKDIVLTNTVKEFYEIFTKN